MTDVSSGAQVSSLAVRFAFRSLTLVLATVPSLAAAACLGESGPLTMPLIELYTASACETCRPAERWLAEHGRQGAAAITLHMDLIGYGPPAPRVRQRVDRRQYGLSRARRVIVTSPQLFVQGQPAEPGRHGADEAIEREARRPEAAHIAVALWRHDAGSLAASLRVSLAKPGLEGARLYYAGFVRRAVEPAASAPGGLDEAAILQWSGPLDIPANGQATHDVIAPLPPGASSGPAGLVAFVEAGSPPRVVQSVVAPLCRNAGVR